MKDRGNGRYKTSCPTATHAKGDRSAGLAVSELDDGRLLIWCPVGCSAADITAAVGLDLCDLFPADIDKTVTRHRRTRSDLVKVIYDDALLITVAAANLPELLSDDIVKVKAAGSRIEKTLREAL